MLGGIRIDMNTSMYPSISYEGEPLLLKYMQTCAYYNSHMGTHTCIHVNVNAALGWVLKMS